MMRTFWALMAVAVPVLIVVGGVITYAWWSAKDKGDDDGS